MNKFSKDKLMYLKSDFCVLYLTGTVKRIVEIIENDVKKRIDIHLLQWISNNYEMNYTIFTENQEMIKNVIPLIKIEDKILVQGQVYQDYKENTTKTPNCKFIRIYHTFIVRINTIKILSSLNNEDKNGKC